METGPEVGDPEDTHSSRYTPEGGWFFTQSAFSSAGLHLELHLLPPAGQPPAEQLPDADRVGLAGDEDLADGAPFVEIDGDAALVAVPGLARAQVDPPLE